MTDKTDLLTDPFSYFTIWSLLISYSIFIWTPMINVPKWLFLFAACFLTTTSILGTFFLTIPNAKNEAEKRKTSLTQIMLEDSLIHTGPLVLFLVLFCFLGRYITQKKLAKYDYYKVLFVCIVIIFAYLGYIKFQQIYYYDYFTLVILTACIFVTSFQIYLSVLNGN